MKRGSHCLLPGCSRIQFLWIPTGKTFHFWGQMTLFPGPCKSSVSSRWHDKDSIFTFLFWNKQLMCLVPTYHLMPKKRKTFWCRKNQTWVSKHHKKTFYPLHHGLSGWTHKNLKKWTQITIRAEQTEISATPGYSDWIGGKGFWKLILALHFYLCLFKQICINWKRGFAKNINKIHFYFDDFNTNLIYSNCLG